MKVLMTLVLVLLLAGCAAGEGGAGESGAGSITTEEETTAYKQETTVLGGGNLPRPPDSTLSYGGREVKGALGSYCWGDGGTHVCGDGPFITPPRKKMLSVPSDSEMVFRYGGQRAPDKVEVEANSLKWLQKTAVVSSRQHSEGPRFGSRKDYPCSVATRRVRRVVVVTEPQGDASYFFRIMVE